MFNDNERPQHKRVRTTRRVLLITGCIVIIALAVFAFHSME